MMTFSAKFKSVVMGIVILALLASVGYVGYDVFAKGLSDHSVIAVVGTEKIKAAPYNRFLHLQETELRRQGIDLEEGDIERVKQGVLQALMFESAIVQSALKYGLNVSDFELAYAIQTSPMFTNDGLFSKQAYVWTVRNQLNMNPADFEREQRRVLLMRKMSNLLASAYKLTPEEIKYNFKVQYGNLKDFEKKAADFAPTIAETKANAAQENFLANFNSNNEVKVVLQE